MIGTPLSESLASFAFILPDDWSMIVSLLVINHSFCPASQVVIFAFSNFFLSSPSRNIWEAVPLSSLLNLEVLS